MRRDRKNKTILLSVLVALIFSMSIVFAAMSTTLKVKGTGLVSASEWSIKFENLSPATLKGAAQETTAPTIKNDTEIGEYSVVLKRTGDEVSYNFDIHNYGKVNAKIEELNIPTPVCTGNATDEEQKIADAQIVSESIAYTLTYSDGTEVNVGDTLKADEVKSLVLKLAYTGENMPSESVQITGLAITMKHGQDMSETPEEPIELPEIAGKRYAEETKIMVNDVPVTIPGGATVSGLAGECENVDDGLVAYIIPEGEEVTDWKADTDGNGIIDVQEKYDQFVWVPVENPVLDLSDNPTALETQDKLISAVKNEVYSGRYPMAVKKDDNNYIGVSYGYYESGGTARVSMSDAFWKPYGNGKREPIYLTSTAQDAGEPNNVGITQDSLQEEFNIMVEKVSNNGGFWIGRYETSNMKGSSKDNSYDETQQIDIVKGAIDGMNGTYSVGLDWYRMYAQQKNYASHVNISSISSMLWNCQRHQILIWMKDVKNKFQDDEPYLKNSIGMGNFKYNIDGTEKSEEEIMLKPTGSSEDYKVKNIYDLAGNVSEATMGGNDTYQRIFARI